MKKRKIIFSDTDGVIAKYKREGFIPDKKTGIMPYEIPGGHYFLKCVPDEVIIKAYKIIAENAELCILTNINSMLEAAQEHTDDKFIWIAEKMPFIDISKQLHVIDMPKYQKAQEILGRNLEPDDVLISDFNRDLFPWEEKGGCGIKYLNGINSPHSFGGSNVSHEMTSEDIADHILRCAGV